MIGQAALITLLHKQFLAATDGGATCVVSGGPGSGKTFLANRFLRDLPQNTVRLRGRGLRTGTAPLLPICEAIRTCNEGANLDRFRTVAEEYLQAIPYVKDAFAPLLKARSMTIDVRAELRQAIPSETYTYVVLARLLESLGGHDVPVLFLDDVQWIDPSSIGFLGYLAAQIRERKVFVLLTRRVNGQDHELVQALLETLRREAGERNLELSINGLTRGEQVGAIESLIGRADLSAADLDWLEASTQGNPYYLREIVGLLQSEGLLCAVNGVWRIANRPPRPIVPPSLHQYLTKRIVRATDGDALAQTAIQFAACIGTVFDARIIADALHESAARVGTVIDSFGASTGLICRQGKSTLFSFDHDLTRDAIVTEMGEFAAETHMRLATVLATRQGVDPGVVAYQFASAGANKDAAEWYLAAARIAATDSLHDAALQYGRKAEELVKDVSVGALALQATTVVGASLLGAERYAEAVELLSSKIDEFSGENVSELRHLLGRASARLPDHVSHLRAVAELRTALAGRGDLAQAAVWSDLVYAYDAVGDYDASQAAFRAALREAKRVGDDAALVRLMRLTCIFWQPEKVRETLTRAIAIAHRHKLFHEEAMCENNLGCVCIATRDLERAWEHCTRAYDALGRLGGYRRDTPMNNLGLLALLAGDAEKATGLLNMALEVSHDKHSQLFIRSNLALASAACGNVTDALARLESAVSDADQTGDLFYRNCLRHNYARALANEGRCREAHEVVIGCPLHHSGGDDALVRAKRARLVMDILENQALETPDDLRQDAIVLDRTTKPQAWLYRQQWYYCDIEFWED